MYNPYPGSTQMPETSLGPVPESVRSTAFFKAVPA